MGAANFFTKSTGRTVEDAFRRAVDEAHWAVGHGGYSGTIAEKDAFIVIDVPNGEEPERYAKRLLDQDDPRVADKFGPAGAVELRQGEWLFFGSASS